MNCNPRFGSGQDPDQPLSMSLFSFATSPPLSCFCRFESLIAKGCAVLRLLILTVTYFRDRALSSAVEASAKPGVACREQAAPVPRSGPRAGCRRLFWPGAPRPGAAR